MAICWREMSTGWRVASTRQMAAARNFWWSTPPVSLHLPSGTSMLRYILTTCALVLSTIRPSSLPAQGASTGDAGVYLTVFRSPSTGVEVRGDRFAVHGGLYPTILKADNQSKGENTNFVRLGAAMYYRPSGWSPYVSPALLFSLDDDWKNAVLSEVGVRLPIAGRGAFRLGVGVLSAFDGEVRVNPTVGLDIRLRGRR